MELSERDQANDWRIEPCGWDKDEHIYFVLDDNRLYRRTDPPVDSPDSPKPIPTTKSGRTKGKVRANAKSIPVYSRGVRASKRFKVENEEDFESGEIVDVEETKILDELEMENDHLDGDDCSSGIKWECVAVSLQDYQEFLATIQKSRDPNEKALYKSVVASVMPIIEAAEERQRQKMLRRQRELEAVEKLATAKRSSRIADKRQQEIEGAEVRALQRKRQQDLLEAQAMLLREQRMEEDRQSRRLTREQRLKERDLRRVLEEEALNNLTAVEAQGEQSEGEGRKSKRQLRAEIENKRKAVEELQQEDNWIFDCSSCGIHGNNLDDGSHSVACDRCNIWQHSVCLGISEVEAEKDDFHFICKDCLQKEEDLHRPRPPPIKLKLNQISSSPPSAKKSKKQHIHANGTPKAFKSRKQANESSHNGSPEWQHTFAYPQPPAYGKSPNNFIAFKPGRYYVNGTNPTQGTLESGSSGFGTTVPPYVPGQPPIGKFINHTNKASPTSQAKHPATNGYLYGSTSSEALGQQSNANRIPEQSGRTLSASQARPSPMANANNGEALGTPSALPIAAPSNLISISNPQDEPCDPQKSTDTDHTQSEPSVASTEPIDKVTPLQETAQISG